MSASLENFIFEKFDPSGSCGLTFQVNCGKVLSKQMLFDAYGAGLDAPNKYFGLNWDAFSDCLMGLEWLEARHINIVHDGLPRLTGEDLAVYLEILSIAVADWNGEKTATLQEQYPDFKAHALLVYFPRSVRGEIESLLTQQ